jgi:SAM-dependent methyltransferase
MSALDELLRCPVCGCRLQDEYRCPRCGGEFPVEGGIVRMLDDRLPGIAAKRAEIDGWVALAREQEWYRADDDVDRVLPYVNRDLGWDDEHWGANERAFTRLLADVRPGMRVLELGAAKCWGARHVRDRGAQYVACDILDDPLIGLGRGAFYGDFPRVQADGEHLPFHDGAFDLAYCVATLHHALDLRAMVHELARVTRPGGLVAALNEGVRGLRTSPENPEQAREKELGINEHVHTAPAYVWAFLRAGLWICGAELTAPPEEIASRRFVGRLLPRARRTALVLAALTIPYEGISLFGRRLTR